ncbi:hypothetical protein [Streptomyces sp. JJ38]|uniref:hypothetical protein n=1 Tax=Streptomyces sp. JJ38 TaxID=2738128 RepID=UPI001C588A7A|nr:hypothetical protein [Streptomyces sp. JJ38]MBW1600393.1 hypothetical protein [Streptomyces sp. JJ38]
MTTYARTELTERILDYVTKEFTAGVEGNRQTLPSTFQVAKACVRGGGKAKSCRRALRHLNRLMWSGEIIQVKGEDVSPRHWNLVYWALPDSNRAVGEDGLQIPVAVTVSGLDTPVNRFGFTDEAWAAMKPWQRNAIRSIEMADTESSSWQGGES